MKIRTALALAALSITPAFAAEPAATRTALDDRMTAVEKSTVESLQKQIAMLQETVDQVRKASAERAIAQEKQAAQQSTHELWP